MTSSSVFMTTAYMNFSVIWIIKWNLIALQQCHGKYLALLWFWIYDMYTSFRFIQNSFLSITILEKYFLACFQSWSMRQIYAVYQNFVGYKYSLLIIELHIVQMRLQCNIDWPTFFLGSQVLRNWHFQHRMIVLTFKIFM